MIEVEHLTKQFGGRTAVRDISFRVNRGEILGFLGPNGAGKTTTMRILTCFLPATSGAARVDGFDVFAQSLEVRRRVGYLPENPPLYDEMTVGAYLEFAARIRGVPRRAVRARREAAAERCGLTAVLGRVIGHLSRGYRQRVGLAQAIVHDPAVLVLDEPTVGLDPAQIVEIRNMIRDLGRDRTIIFSTHILPEVASTCTNVVIINEGVARVAGPLDSLTSGGGATQGLRVQVARDGDEVAGTLGGIHGVRGVTPVAGRAGGYRIEADRTTDLRERISACVVERGWGLIELTPVDPTLEEIYMSVMSGAPTGAPS